MKRKFFIEIGLLIGCCVAGLTLSYFVARNIQVHAGRANLKAYANRLLHTGDDLAVESDHALKTVLGDHAAFCSDREINLMRVFVFNASNVRDIGRVKDGKLVCSTGMGRLEEPQPMPVPNIALHDMKIYVDAPILISRQTTGFITEIQGVSIVLNPDAYRTLDEGPLSYSGYFFDRTRGLVLRGFGHVVPLTPAEVIAGKFIERKGIIYLPRCSETSAFCVVAAEHRADMLLQTRWLADSFTFAGGSSGVAIALIAVLVYRRQRSLQQQLRRAVRKEQITLVYQPIIDLEAGTIVAAEALARWTNEDREYIRPDIFIPLAEEHGFVGQITRFVLQQALSELGDLLTVSNFRIMLNITAQDLTDPAFMLHLESSAQAANIPPSAIGIEITERSTIDQQAATAALANLKRAGYSVYIDDFGTGYSSLAYLHLLAVDAIKIDPTFTQTVGTQAVTASVVPQILDMAAQLNLQVGVEGIETPEQAEYFRKAGRGILGQGWLFGKPMPAAQLRQLLQKPAPTFEEEPSRLNPQ